MISVSRIRVEHLRETLGIGEACPRISWQVETDIQNWTQAAYEIECRGETYRVESSQSVLVDWDFAPLQSRERIDLRVRVWGTDGSESLWSEPVSVEAGLFQPEDWTANFITPTWDENPDLSNPSPYLRREFELRSNIKSARLYITALGVYEAEINGQLVSDHVLAPGWTAYDEHLRYQTFDVTDLLTSGKNAIGAILGDGWYRGRLGFGGGKRNIYGDKLALLAQLEIQYADGSKEIIVTDENWRAATGAILMSSIYDGESYDARLEPVGWTKPDFDDSTWLPTTTLRQSLEPFAAPLGVPVRRTEEIRPVSISKSPSGKTLVDFGQNLVGRIQLKVTGEAGQVISLRHAEVLENGELGTRPLRMAEATDRYICKGEDVEIWEPRFTFHGFRYAEVSGWNGELITENLTAIVIHSDMERTGWFETSDPLLNQLHQNVVWGMRGNFLDVPTDCPQRDERMGWTGDIQVFSPTASFLYDASGFLQSWLKDLAIEQRKLGGMVPAVVPSILPFGAGAAAWGDAATVVPWVLYQRFGDARILADQFESMCNWVDFIATQAGENLLWDTGFQFGDWLDPTAPPDKPAQARTDKTIVASAYFAHSADLVARAAQVLNDTEAENKYGALAEKAKNAFAGEYTTRTGRMMSDAETAYALALVFDLFHTEEQRQHAGKRLAALVMDSGYRIRTGFVGTPLICDALCQTGQYRTAYRLLMQKENPSWLYPVTMGATTIWERWDSMLPDGSINPGEMTSFNHYALGAVADWMQRTIGGIAPVEAGYRRMKIAPHPGGGLTHANTQHRTPYGLAKVFWTIENDTFTLDIVIPPNASAEVNLPNGEKHDVGSGKWQWSQPYENPDTSNSYSVDDLVGEIMYEPAAMGIIFGVLDQLGAPGFIKGILSNERNMPLREALKMLPNYDEAVETMNAALATL